MIIRPIRPPLLTPTIPIVQGGGGLPWDTSGGSAPTLAAVLGTQMTVLLDERGQTNVSGALSAWANQGSAGGSWTQSTANNRPALDTAINGWSAPNFDGTNDGLTTTLTLEDIITSGAWYLLCVLLPDTHDAVDGAASGGDLIIDSGTRLDVALHVSGVRSQIYNGTANVAAAYAAISDGSAQLVEAYASAGTISARVGANAPVTNTGTLTNDVLTSNPVIGDRGDVGKLDAKMATLMICDAMPSAAQRAFARAFMSAKYGVAA